MDINIQVLQHTRSLLQNNWDHSKCLDPSPTSLHNVIGCVENANVEVLKNEGLRSTHVLLTLRELVERRGFSSIVLRESASYRTKEDVLNLLFQAEEMIDPSHRTPEAE